MRGDKIVVRCKNKSLMKGRAYNFDPESMYFNMKLLDGERLQLKLEDLKAVFIVKNYDGNRNYRYTYKDVLFWGGMKIKITFFDNEIMIGYVPHHISDEAGFYVTPADLKGNNKKVFVIRSATRDITYL